MTDAQETGSAPPPSPPAGDGEVGTPGPLPVVVATAEPNPWPRSLALVLVAAAGAMLVGYGLFGRGGPALEPGPIGPRSETYAVLLDAALGVDAACADGDLDAFDERTTPALRRTLADQFERVGSALGARTLQDQGALVGDLADRTLLAGAVGADGNVAVLVHSMGSVASRFLQSDVRRGLHAVRFVRGTSGGLQLDLRAVRQLGTSDDERELADAWVGELLRDAGR